MNIFILEQNKFNIFLNFFNIYNTNIFLLTLSSYNFLLILKGLLYLQHSIFSYKYKDLLFIIYSF